jgi:hypothetical protein
MDHIQTIETKFVPVEAKLEKPQTDAKFDLGIGMSDSICSLFFSIDSVDDLLLPDDSNPYYEPCNHKCSNKKTCSHECCKVCLYF